MKKILFILLFFSSSALNAQPVTTIDILVLFSNDASTSTNYQDAQSYINSTNQSFINSNINVRVNLAGAVQINYNDATSLVSDLEMLKPSGSSTPANIESLRNNHTADLVILIVKDGDGTYNGVARPDLGSLNTPILNSDYAYAVVAKDKAIDPNYYTFSHEIGHLVGLVHDGWSDQPGNNQSYNYQGFETSSCSGSAKKHLSIMATVKNSIFITKVNRWSDPNSQITIDTGSPDGGGDDDDGEGGGPGGNGPNLNFGVVLDCSVPFGTTSNNSKLGWEQNASTVSQYRNLSAPTGLTVTTGSAYGEPYLDWNNHPSPSFNHFKIYRKTNITYFQHIGTTSSSNYSDWEVSDKYSSSTQFQYAVKAFDANGNNSSYSNSVFYDGELMNLKTRPQSETPIEFSLSNNYPNPFNPSTQISFGLPENSDVSLRVYNLMGQEVAVLVDEAMNPGFHEITFNADNLPSGTYFAKMIANSTSGNTFTKEIKMQLIK